jgi:signal transduction histidine kinase
MATTEAELPREPRISWASLRLVPPLMWIPLIAVLLTTLAVYGLSEWSARRAHASGERVAVVLQRLDALSELKSLVLDVEAGQRGYLLTRDPVYLTPFAEAVRNLPSAEALVTELTRNTSSEPAVDRVRKLIAERVEHATRTINLFNEGRRDEALAPEQAARGRALIDEIRGEIARIDSLSHTELARLQEEQAVSATRSRLGLLFMTLVSLGLLIMVTRLFLAEAVRQDNRRCAAEREAKEMEKLVEARTRELSALSTHLQDFAEKEKSELARNLHDELGGLLTAAKMDLSWLQSRVDNPQLQQRLTQLGSVLDDAMDLKRRVVDDLRPSLLDHFGLPTALRAYLEQACGKAGLECEVTVADEDAENIPKDIAIALFRVVQEGLTNIVRHAHAKQVHLELSTSSSGYLLKLTDDGQGFDAKDPTFRWSHGLTGMRHRVRALGGRFTIDSNPGNGTTVFVQVPMRPQSAQ